ncbi:MAG: transporter substrate-binding protein [Frankiales bacterium]|nr:transporter substrate-binding protein [Frankiales bacterium]
MKRLGAGAGFAGDRLDPAVDLAERGQLDALVFECLAERTIALAQSAVLEGRGPGFDPLLQERLEAVLPATLRSGAVVVTNAGAARPRAAGDMVASLGVPGVVVAVADGDDVLDRLKLADSVVLGGRDGETLEDHRDRIVSANAYLGCEAIVAALDAGANVVITGRTSDAALFLGPLVHWYGWSSLDELAAGTLVGHLLECAGQLTGGYFADGVRKQIPGLARLGFPYADVAADGSARLAKLEGPGGRLDRLTVLEQLLYEVSDPTAYVTPDVVVDFSHVEISSPMPDVVDVGGARGSAAPEQLKVSVGVTDGFRSTAEISYAGSDCLARAVLAADVVAERWRDVHGQGHVELSRQLIGINACTPWADVEDEPAEVRLRLVARTLDERAAVLLGREVESLYTNGPAGGGGVTTTVTSTLGLLSTLIPSAEVIPTMTVCS